MATLVKKQPIKKRRRTEPFTGPQETVEEFLARGGKITRTRARRMIGDPIVIDAIDDADAPAEDPSAGGGGGGDDGGAPQKEEEENNVKD